jgi:hypothetical protein
MDSAQQTRGELTKTPYLVCSSSTLFVKWFPLDPILLDLLGNSTTSPGSDLIYMLAVLIL